MNKHWMTFILVSGAVLGTFSGTQVVEGMHRAYTANLEDDLEKCQDSLDTWQAWCTIAEAETTVDAFGYPRFVCRQ